MSALIFQVHCISMLFCGSYVICYDFFMPVPPLNIKPANLIKLFSGLPRRELPDASIAHTGKGFLMVLVVTAVSGIALIIQLFLLPPLVCGIPKSPLIHERVSHREPYPGI